MDCIKPITDSIQKCVIDFLAGQIKYLINCRGNVEKLQTAVKDLEALRNDKKAKLTAEENAGRVETETAKQWFKKVEEIAEKADKKQKMYEQARCAGGWCVNCWSRVELSRDSEKFKQDADDLIGKADQFDLTSPAPVESAERMEIQPIANYLSTPPVLEETLARMESMESGIIGIYGMGGVGKTTLARKVNNYFFDNPRFQTVIMVTVSQNPNIQNIQTRISERLGLDLKDPGTDEAKREKLLRALRKKKFLLILDDVWSELELDVIGVPHPGNHKGSMILITSRDLKACTDMSAEPTIKVNELSDDDSFDLFVHIAGTHIKGDDRIEGLAKKIAGRCGGLPLVIITVAHAMKNHVAVADWRIAARDLDAVRVMKGKVYEPLKFSYDRLGKDVQLQSLFLYCACFPEDYNIGESELLNYCFGEGFVDSRCSLEAAMDRVKTMTSELKIVCMLEDGEDEGSVRMHDMMRELARWITSPESSDGSSPKFLIRTRESSVKASNAVKWEDATRISFIESDVDEVPELGESCRNLTTLLLWDSIITIPQTNFFQHMEHLKILHLEGLLRLDHVPDSLSCLVNLRVLRIRRCYKLRSLPALGTLRLQVLELTGSFNIKQPIFTPEECAGGLSDLRYLDLSKGMLPLAAGSIRLLLRLETLLLGRALCIGWKVCENGKWYKSNSPYNTCLIDVEELSHLSHLRTLEVTFQGLIISGWIKPLLEKFRDLDLFDCTAAEPDCLQALIESRNLQKFAMKTCSNLRCVPYFVEYLTIEGCDNIEKMLDGAEANQDSFRRLRYLELSNLSKLEMICVGPAPENSFGKLTDISISNCHKLKLIITKEMGCMFNNLDRIYVTDCAQMEVIIEAQQEGSTINGLIQPFPKLRVLRLENLPALVDVCSNHILHCPRIEYVASVGCPKLKTDPLQIRNTMGLLVINNNGEWREGDKVQEEEIQEV